MTHLQNFLWVLGTGICLAAFGIDIHQCVTSIIAGDYAMAIFWIILALMVLLGPISDIVSAIKRTTHFKKWNRWRKGNTNSWFHKLLVLLKLRHSPTFKFTMTDEEEDEMHRFILSLRDEPVIEPLAKYGRGLRAKAGIIDEWLGDSIEPTEEKKEN